MTDDVFFEQAIQEVHNRRVVSALWARALADADGDKVKTIARYVRLRVEQLKEQNSASTSPPTPEVGARQSRPQRPEETVRASAWKRFAARSIDLMWEAPAVGALVGYLGASDAAFTQWVQNTDAMVLSILLMPLVLLFDALVAGLFFNTPGKTLLGLRVVDERQLALDPSTYLRRNMRLWISGLACGVPLLNLFAMAYQGEKVWREGTATYDRKDGFHVLAKPIGIVQSLVIVFVAITLLSLNAVIASAFRQ